MTYSVLDKVLDFVAKDQVITETFTITITDENGGAISQDVEVKINGSNDRPVISGDLAYVARVSSYTKTATGFEVGNSEEILLAPYIEILDDESLINGADITIEKRFKLRQARSKYSS